MIWWVSMESIEVFERDLKDSVYFSVGYLNQIPHKKQIEVLRCKSKNKVVVCGRRAGKSQLIAAELIRGGITGIYKKQIVIAPTYKQSMIVMTKVIELMYESGNEGDIRKVTKSPEHMVVFVNGSRIEFGSADNPDSLRGENYDRVFLDEAAFIKEGAMDAIRPLIYDTGAPIWFTTTPMGKGIVWDFWIRGMNGDEDYGCFNYCYLDNPYITEEGKKEIEKDIREWGENSNFVQAEIYGNFVDEMDCYFNRELIEKCIDGQCYSQVVAPKARYVLGCDIASEGEDESVFVVLEIPAFKDEINLVEIRNYEVNKPREVVGMIVELDEKYGFERIYMDKTGGGEGPTDWVCELLGDDRVEGIRFNIQNKADMYSNLKKIMNQGKLRIPNHKKLIYQMMELRYERTSNGGMKIHHPDEKTHDDYPDALALASLWFKDEEVGEYESFIF